MCAPCVNMGLLLRLCLKLLSCKSKGTSANPSQGYLPSGDPNNLETLNVAVLD